MNKIKYKMRKVINLQDWDKLVTEAYGKPYDFQQQDGCKSRGTYTLYVNDEEIEDDFNDSIPFEVNGDIMGIKFEVWKNTDPKDHREQFDHDYEVELFWDRNFYPNIEVLANDLCKKGLIEEGVYDIKIDW